MIRCHVKGCDEEGKHPSYFPDFGCVLSFCDEHNATTEQGRCDWFIELARAKEEHDATMNAMERHHL